MGELILSILLVITTILFIIILFKYLSITSSLKQVKERIEYLNHHETNLLIDSASKEKNLHTIVELFNQNLLSTNQLKQKIIQEEIELKNTITNLSHDLRTPITSILGYTKLLKQASGLSDKQLEYLKIIESRIDTLKTLVEALFNYSKLFSQNTLNLNEENITSILEEAILLFYNDFKAQSITPEIEILAKPCIKLVDKLALKRVFLNIISNALKHGSGELSIKQTPNQISFKNKVTEVDQIDLEKLFNRFFTVAKARTSSSIGLGLTISKTLMEAMNGSIKAEIESDYLIITLQF